MSVDHAAGGDASDVWTLRAVDPVAGTSRGLLSGTTSAQASTADLFPRELVQVPMTSSGD
ncbi:MAG TPA: hypothetical protein VGC67_04600 [Cellulomonas sp.]